MTAIKDKTELLNYIRSVDWSQFETDVKSVVR